MVASSVVREDARRALAEDAGDGDLTADLLPEASLARATVICREPAVICGTAWFEAVYAELDPAIRVHWHVADGDSVAAETQLCQLDGPARALVTGERTALNFLQFLSGTATVARRFVDALGDTATRLLDTRKTIPGLRRAQKYATRCGGCVNHRMGLYDAILIKENHIMAAGSIAAAVAGSRRRHPGASVEVEVENLDELDEALTSGADSCLLDNFAMEDLGEAVRRTAGRAKLEASGNVELDRLAAIAATGVDYVSTGALTKHVRAIDLSMRFDQPA